MKIDTQLPQTTRRKWYVAYSIVPLPMTLMTFNVISAILV